jgi:hypothetical protein
MDDHIPQNTGGSGRSASLAASEVPKHAGPPSAASPGGAAVSVEMAAVHEEVKELKELLLKNMQVCVV